MGMDPEIGFQATDGVLFRWSDWTLLTRICSPSKIGKGKKIGKGNKKNGGEGKGKRVWEETGERGGKGGKFGKKMGRGMGKARSPGQWGLWLRLLLQLRLRLR